MSMLSFARHVAINLHVKRRVNEDELRLFVAKELPVTVQLKRVTTKQTMLSERPEVSELCSRGGRIIVRRDLVSTI